MIEKRKARAAARRNPSGTVRAIDLRAGDTIELEDLGREHIIRGPFRSGRGIKFENKYGDYVILSPNERVRLLARENPSSAADQLRLELADALLTMRATNHRLKIQDTSHGGLLATNVDVYKLASHPADLRKITRIAALRDYSLQVGRGALLLMPL